MLDAYLLRLSERSKPGIRKEVARLRENLDSVTAAMAIVADMRSTVLVDTIAHGLHWLEDDLVRLKWYCNQMALHARRAVCKKIPEHRRRKVILSAMDAIVTAYREPMPDRGAGTTNEALIVSEAALVDPALFERVIADFRSSGMSDRSSRSGSRAPSVREAGFMGRWPNVMDPSSAWFSFVVALRHGIPDDTPGAAARTGMRQIA